jgi:hypothetical protein
MTSLIRGRALAPALVFFLAHAFFLTLAPPAAAGAAARLRIKNGHGLTVALGKTREPATGIRPEKKIWTLELDASLVGADAELRDVTPNMPGARWSVPVETEHLVLDATRFLAGHVYRLEVRRERQLLGSALVYLYPPPVERVSRVNLDDAPEAAEKGFTPATLPKGGL